MTDEEMSAAVVRALRSTDCRWCAERFVPTIPEQVICSTCRSVRQYNKWDFAWRQATEDMQLLRRQDALAQRLSKEKPKWD